MADHDDLTTRLRDLGTRPIEGPQRSADLTAMAAVRPAQMGAKVRIAAAFLAGLLLGGAGLASADALPDPAQHAAHGVLAKVGVDVPDPARYHGPECGPEVKRNHGGYVRDDHSLAGSACGKPLHAGKGADNGDEDRSGAGDDGADKAGGPSDTDPCEGKPPWAVDKTMTPTEKTAAQAARRIECGTDADAGAGEDDRTEAEADAGNADDGEDEDQDEGGDGSSDQPSTTEAPATTSTTA